MLEFFDTILGLVEGIFYYFSGAVAGLTQLLKVWVGALNSNGGVQWSISLLPDMFIALATLVITLRVIMAIVHGGQ